jgi:two-component system, NarL family, nitrate/nitrite response regulator NarL
MAEDDLSMSATPIRILLFCGIRLYADAVSGLLARAVGLCLQACTHDRENILAAYDQAAPDVVLLDSAGHGALEAAARLIRARPLARLLGFGVHDQPVHVVACAQAGLAGYVPSTASLHDLVTATRRIGGGGTVCSAAMAGGLFRHVRGAALGQPAPDQAVLTPRQREIVRLLADGLSNKEIARRLRLGTSTVKNHVHEILGRLNVTGRSQVAASLYR